MGVRKTARDRDVAYPRAAPLLHLMSMLLHWAVVGFGKATFWPFQSKKKD